MGGIYPGGGYPAQYSQGGSVPPDVIVTAMYIVTARADVSIITARPDVTTIIATADPDVEGHL